MITEPGSARGLVQIAGRCLRHREREITSPNVLILERCYRDVVDGNPTPFSYPGLETPLPCDGTKLSVASVGIRLESRTAAGAYDLEGLAEGIDASPIIVSGGTTSFEPSASYPLAEMEAKLNGLWLEDGFGDLGWTVNKLVVDPLAFLTTGYGQNRRFRRSSGNETVFYYETQEREAGWHRFNDKGQRESCASMVDAIAINVSRLLFRLDSEEDCVEAYVGMLADRDEDLPTWKVRQLTAAKAAVGKLKASARFAYDRHIGFFLITDRMREGLV